MIGNITTIRASGDRGVEEAAEVHSALIAWSSKGARVSSSCDRPLSLFTGLVGFVGETESPFWCPFAGDEACGMLQIIIISTIDSYHAHRRTFPGWGWRCLRCSAARRRLSTKRSHPSQSICDPARYRERMEGKRAAGWTFCIFIRTFLCVGSLPYLAKSSCSCSVNFCKTISCHQHN